MAQNDYQRIDAQHTGAWAKPAAGLWRALRPLRSAASWLMVGAHPDDEWSGFLAWLSLGQGLRTAYACALRGEGGQNAIGPEQGADLGALRSLEMERAAAVLGTAIHWLNEGEDDPLVDFGFSKSAADTLARWGRERLVGRLARVIRSERPDVVSPTFLDVPGQHGHHRAITACTWEAVARAADPAYADGLPPWRVAKTYLPAFSGAGAAYDDREPPPPETMRVELGEGCPELGATWAQIGEWSRRCHASQGMGRWIEPGPRPLLLHLRSGSADRGSPLDNLPASLRDLSAAAPVLEADSRIAAALADPTADALHAALGAVARARAALTDAPELDRRLALKQHQLARAAAGALGIAAALEMPTELRAGGTARIGPRLDFAVAVATRLRLPQGWRATPEGSGWRVAIPADAPPFGTARPGYDPLGGSDVLGVTLSWEHGGGAAAMEIDPPQRVCLGPPRDVTATPSRIAIPRGGTAELRLRGAPPPPGWPVLRQQEADGAHVLRLAAPADRLVLPPAGTQLRRIAHPHAGTAARIVAAQPVLQTVDLAIDPRARVGVVAADPAPLLGWLTQIGIAAAPASDADLAAPGRFTCLLAGIFAHAQRPALAASRAALLDWMRAGGALVTLYHRPGDNWDPDRTPPCRLAIGSPSFRWRVTDPAAPVAVLAPDHPCCAGPTGSRRPTGKAGWASAACISPPAGTPPIPRCSPPPTRRRRCKAGC